MADKNAAEFNELYPKTEYQSKADKQKLEDWTKGVYDKMNETSKTNIKANAEIPQSSSAEGKGSDIERKTPQNAAGGTPSSDANVIYWSKDIKKEEQENKEKINKLNEFVKNNPTQDEVIDFIIKTYPDLKDREYIVNQLDYLFENGRKKYDIKLDDVRTIPVNKQESQNEQTPQTSVTITTPTTPQKKSDTEDLTKGGLGDGIPEVGSFYTPDVREELNAIDKSMEKEQQTGHKFYSRIFSVPEWFPKGLDEFREKKRELTDKPVYDKKSGKYERNTTGKMATAKAEQEMAEEVIDGLQRDVNNARDKGFISDPILNKRSKEQYEKSVSVLNDINKQIDDIDKEYNDLAAIEYKGTGFDSLAKEQDRKERLSALRQQREEAKNKLSEQEDIVNKFKTQYETRGDATSNLIESQQETIDAIKNGDLKDANEAVDNLKEEYRAAKRKLIKENAGDIARNVWFIIDLVTTMNRNAARLMPQGKYSPNLGNFETPALFQDYAEQLKNIRDSYNEANKEAAVGKVRLGLERGSEANKAIGEYYKNLADKDKDIFDLSVQTEKDRRAALIRIMENKETGRFDNELKKDYIKFYMDTHKNTQASLQEMLNDIDSVNTFINRPRVLAGLDKQQQQNWLYYNQATSPDTKDAIFKELVTDIYRRGIDEKKSDEEIKNDVRNFLIDLIRNEVATTNDTVKLRKYQNKLNYINSTTDTFGKAWENIIDKPVATGQRVVDAVTDVVNPIQ